VSNKKLLLFLLPLFLCSGCFRRTYVPESEPATTISFVSTKATNAGTPFYIVLKFTDFPGFLVDDYQTIANLSSAPDSNTDSFISLCLIPGKTEKIKSKPPPGQSTAIYCLFTDCGEQWKYLIEAKEECQEVTILLGEHEISAVSMR
jgi:hypothetical protein